MGGRGSGRLFRWDAKRTTAGAHSIDIRDLKKWGSLQPGREGSLSWSRNGEKIASIGYMVAGDSLLVMNSLLEKEGMASKVQMGPALRDQIRLKFSAFCQSAE